MDKTSYDISKHNLRFKPYPLKKPIKKNTEYHLNATLAKLQSLSNSFKTLFSRFITNDDSDNSISQKNDCHKSDKKVKFNIIPNFLESENYEYSKDSYFYYSSSGVPSSNKSNQAPNSIIKSKQSQDVHDSSQKWICKNCLTTNFLNNDICFQCKFFKRELNTTLIKKNRVFQKLDLNSIDQFNTKAWKCIECSFANETSENYCKNCRIMRYELQFNSKYVLDEKKFSNKLFNNTENDKEN